MAKFESDTTFNIHHVLKSLRATELKNKEIEVKLSDARSSLEEVKKQRDAILSKCEEEEFKVSQYKKEASLLEERIPHKRATGASLQRRLEDLCAEMADVEWSGTRARLVLESERLSRQLAQKTMDKRVEELTATTPGSPKEEDQSEKDGGGGGVGEVGDIREEKETLLQEVAVMKDNLWEQEKMLEEVKTKSTIFKNRNNAIRLRMRRRLQQAYQERCKLDDMVAELRKRVHEEGLAELLQDEGHGDVWPELKIDSIRLP